MLGNYIKVRFKSEEIPKTYKYLINKGCETFPKGTLATHSEQQKLFSSKNQQALFLFVYQSISCS